MSASVPWNTHFYEFTFNDQIQSYSTSSSNYPAWASKKTTGEEEMGKKGERDRETGRKCVLQFNG